MQIGRKIGVKIRIAGVGSIKVPTNSKITLIRRKIKNLLLVTLRTAVATISGIPVKAIAQDMIEDKPIMNVMVPVILAESRTILGISFTLIEP